MIISTEQTKGGKIKLFADGEYIETFESAFWYSQGLYDGDEADVRRLREVLVDYSLSRALNTALGLLSRRAHSRRELQTKLTQKGYDGEACEYAVERAAELGLLDDADYARQLAESLLERKGYSPQRIRSELIQKGIARDIIDDTLEELEDDPVERITQLLETKYSSYARDENGRRKAFSALMRLGYNINDIRIAIRESGVFDGDDIE